MKLTAQAKERINNAVTKTDYNSNSPKIVGYKMQLGNKTTPQRLRDYLTKLETKRAKDLAKEDHNPQILAIN